MLVMLLGRARKKKKAIQLINNQIKYYKYKLVPISVISQNIKITISIQHHKIKNKTRVNPEKEKKKNYIAVLIS